MGASRKACLRDVFLGKRFRLNDWIARKASLLTGRNYWSTAEVFGIPSVTMTDGPNGVRMQKAQDQAGFAEGMPATCYPSPCLTACTFDPVLAELVGAAIGEEAVDQGASILLAPGLNIKRHPLGGRNFEYFSEDPLLAGRMGAAYVRGVESSGAGACVKHFAANSQETRRMTSDSVVDESTLCDIYLRPFEIAVKEGRPEAVMTAYNRLNGKYCSQNPWLLGKLRGEWGFRGLVVSDWGAMDESVPSVAAGLDLCMPGPRRDHVRAVREAAESGKLSMEALDRASSAVASLAAEHGSSISHARPRRGLRYGFDEPERLALAQLVAEAGCVLLENDGTLPIAPGCKVAVIGAFAKEPRYQGTGSSRVNPSYLDCAWDAFSEADVDATYTPGYDARDGSSDEAALADARSAAEAADLAVVFVGLPDSWEAEGHDRRDMRLPDGMNALVEEVLAANPRTVVAVSAGGPVEMPWRLRVSAVLLSHLAGCRGGHAVVNLLTGEACPSGRLAETWPERLEDTALGGAFPARSQRIPYIEGPFVGYRYYQAAGVEPAYPFGYGLSYTAFSYNDARVETTFEGCDISVVVENTGRMDGFEVVQAYVSDENRSLPGPSCALAAFKRVFVPARKKVKTSLHIPLEAFSHWDAATHSRRIEEGTRHILVGPSSEDVRARLKVVLRPGAPFPTRKAPKLPEEKKAALRPYFEVRPHGFDETSFEALYGKPLPSVVPTLPFTENSRIGDLGQTALGRAVLAAVETAGRIATSRDPEEQRMFEEMFHDLPLRSMLMGGVPKGVLDAAVWALNSFRIE